ncbi:MAG: M20/M25/M40 family metallo-hydrolase [Caldithrix sp.]|nr:M20/M25/M40 family metallo-hydrolase [Caldithrix sp.]
MITRPIIVLVSILMLAIQAKAETIHHALHVRLNPAEQTFSAIDTITIPVQMQQKSIRFVIHENLNVSLLNSDMTLHKEDGWSKAKDMGMDMDHANLSSKIKLNTYRIQWPEAPSESIKIIMRINGSIHHAIEQMAEEYARSFSTSPGIISGKGVYLAGSSYWVPWFNDHPLTFHLTVHLPKYWDVVSQGQRTLHKIEDGKRITRWTASHPMEEIFVVAAPFYEFNDAAGGVNLMAFLRSDDASLAGKYLETTAQYLQMYRKMIGPFPFSKFALVENFWETGYGMPSFTLLGPKVILFPFILHSSYPHELLHNWWGNSVYVDFDEGNWCEGITAYMADHLIKEQRGQGVEHRRATLQRYTDYVNPQNDFPVNQFKSRHDAPSEAIGYGKSLMMWHMLRRDMGDEPFIKTFQTFYQRFKFKKASFNDIRSVAEEITGKDYKVFFRQWLTRTDAPQLALQDVQIEQSDSAHTLRFKLVQTQESEPFILSIPVALYSENAVEMQEVDMDQKEQQYELTIRSRPLKIAIDPQMQVMRRLHYNEIPPALSKMFGTDSILIVKPSQAPADKQKLYQSLIEHWQKDESKNITVKTDNELQTLDDQKAVWILGDQNRFSSTLNKAITDYNVAMTSDRIRFHKTVLDRSGHTFVVTARHPYNPHKVMAWLTIHDQRALAGLLRKLPHYGKYSYLAFEGTAPDNVAKGQWQAVRSPLIQRIPMADGTMPVNISAQLPKPSALAELQPVFSQDRMLRDVRYLASEEMQGRGLGSDGLEKAAGYIADQFQEAGLKPGGDNGYFQAWEEAIDDQGNKAITSNIVGIIPGSDSDYAGESVVIGAHYDHLGLGWPDVRQGNRGKIHYGADDNASGVAVMLELARNLTKTLQPRRTVIFVAFSAEESGLKGARYYVNHMKKYPVDKIVGMINLDTVGRLDQNKLLVLNSGSAREWKFIFMGAGYVTGVQTEMVSQDLDASDQVAFIEAGVPAVQLFSGAHTDYHRPGDTADKIDGEGMVKVASVAKEGVVYLAGTEEYLTFKGESKQTAEETPTDAGQRRVSTGTMPDFSYSGKGVRIQSISDDSPAQTAGLKPGDILIAMDGQSIETLRDYSNLLKQHQPGDVVELIYLRNEEKQTVSLKLTER